MPEEPHRRINPIDDRDEFRRNIVAEVDIALAQREEVDEEAEEVEALLGGTNTVPSAPAAGSPPPPPPFGGPRVR